MIIKIVSSEKGKQCDKFPCGSIHEGEFDDKGFRLLGESDWIPPVFETEKIVLKLDEIRLCNLCKTLFSIDTPFVKSNQKDDPEMCIRCFERRYIVSRDEYREALKIEIMQELIRNGKLK